MKLSLLLSAFVGFFASLISPCIQAQNAPAVPRVDTVATTNLVFIEPSGPLCERRNSIGCIPPTSSSEVTPAQWEALLEGRLPTQVSVAYTSVFGYVQDITRTTDIKERGGFYAASESQFKVRNYTIVLGTGSARIDGRFYNYSSRRGPPTHHAFAGSDRWHTATVMPPSANTYSALISESSAVMPVMTNPPTYPMTFRTSTWNGLVQMLTDTRDRPSGSTVTYDLEVGATGGDHAPQDQNQGLRWLSLFPGCKTTAVLDLVFGVLTISDVQCTDTRGATLSVRFSGRFLIQRSVVTPSADATVTVAISGRPIAGSSPANDSALMSQEGIGGGVAGPGARELVFRAVSQTIQVSLVGRRR